MSKFPEGEVPQQRTAKITATIWKGKKGPHPDLESEMEMSTDLPADALGELAAEVLQMAWKSGLDPVADGLELVFTFA